MIRRSVNHCIVDYDRSTSRLRIRGLNSMGPLIEFGAKDIPEANINAECAEYWKFVNHSIDVGELTNGVDDLEAFYDKLMTKGTTLCGLLMDINTRDLLWSLARQSDVLVMVTGLLQVPWEALFNSDPSVKSFLGQECVLTRRPERTANSSGRTLRPQEQFVKDRIVMIDAVLAGAPHADLCVKDTFEGDGEEVVITTSHGALVERVRTVRVIHWICEHEPRGLRLRKNHHYTSDDASTHIFPTNSVLMITSCQAGAGGEYDGNIAARICAASNCTVIAPSSLMATRVGVEFARKLNNFIRNSPNGPLKVADLWQRIHGIAIGAPETKPPLSAERCFGLWYGIYGNADNVVRG